MELKNAVAVCLISLVSATLVVLIARSFDSQAAATLEPQLIEIAKELKAIRKAGGIATASGESAENGLTVYYLHGNTRCPTCRSIESQAYETVHADFGPQLENGEIVWEIVNYERPAGEALKKKFDLQQASVVLARMKDGEIAEWKRLDRVWALVGDKPAFREFVCGEITGMLEGGLQPAGTAEVVAPALGPTPDIPLPEASPGDDGPGKAAPDKDVEGDDAPPRLPVLPEPSP